MSIPSISKLSRKKTLDSVSEKLSSGTTHDGSLLDNDETETGNDDDDNSIWIREDQDNVLAFSIGFSLFLIISLSFLIEKSGSPYAEIAELNNLLNSISLKNL